MTVRVSYKLWDLGTAENLTFFNMICKFWVSRKIRIFLVGCVPRKRIVTSYIARINASLRRHTYVLNTQIFAYVLLFHALVFFVTMPLQKLLSRQHNCNFFLTFKNCFVEQKLNKHGLLFLFLEKICNFNVSCSVQNTAAYFSWHWTSTAILKLSNYTMYKLILQY